MHLAPSKTFVNRLKGAKFYCLLPVLNKYDFASFSEIHFCAVAIVFIFFDLEAFPPTSAVFLLRFSGGCVCVECTCLSPFFGLVFPRNALLLARRTWMEKS